MRLGNKHQFDYTGGLRKFKNKYVSFDVLVLYHKNSTNFCFFGPQQVTMFHASRITHGGY